MFFISRQTEEKPSQLSKLHLDSRTLNAINEIEKAFKREIATLMSR
jgi:hypothetical protein